MQPYRPEAGSRYNPKLPKRRPRAMSDEQWLDLFGALRCNRDRALLALAISNAARAGELLGIRCCDLDWGDQLVRVRRKGSGAEQRLVRQALPVVAATPGLPDHLVPAHGDGLARWSRSPDRTAFTKSPGGRPRRRWMNPPGARGG
jgi:integrase